MTVWPGARVMMRTSSGSAMHFMVRHIAPGSASVREERLEGRSAQEIQARLSASGGVILELRPLGRAAMTTRRTKFDVSWWCRELETLLRAGMTPVEAIETLATGQQGPERTEVHASLLRLLHEGAALSRAMRASGAFPEVLVAGVTASERTSTLADALADFLRYDDMLQRLRRQVVSAALYPMMVIALGAVIAVFLLLYVIPRFSRMYGELHGDISTATASVLWISRMLRDAWPLCALLLGAMAVAVGLAWQSGHIAQWSSRLVDQVAPLRHQWDQFRLAKFYQSMALLFRGGYTFDDALQVCSGLGLGLRVGRSIDMAREQIARGRRASAALAHAGLTEPTTERLLAVGERTGAFAAVLQTIADRHAQVFTTFVERATRIVEPVLLLAVAMLVGGLVVMMYMPIFDIAGGLGAAR